MTEKTTSPFEMTYETKYAIGDKVLHVQHQHAKCEIVAVRFTEAKVFYDVLNRYEGVVERDVSSDWITDLPKTEEACESL